jgi:hypothetical protein
MSRRAALIVDSFLTGFAFGLVSAGVIAWVWLVLSDPWK